MSDCGCDDGIGQYVCKKHSTPDNDPFHYLFHAELEPVPKEERPTRSVIEEISSCPCSLVEPCRASCSCAHSFLSGGCDRCCMYGSKEQRLEAAKRVVELEQIAKSVRSIPRGEYKLESVIESGKQCIIARIGSLMSGYRAESDCIGTLPEAIRWLSDKFKK